MERTLATEHLYHGRVVGLLVDTVSLEDGRTTRREIVEHSACVTVLPLDDQERALLVRQYRKPAERDLLELPAGGVEDGESAEACALRELREETAYSAGRIVPLGGFWVAPGYSTEYMHAFVARSLAPAEAIAPEDEAIQVERVPLAELPALVRAGRLTDAKSLAVLLLAAWSGYLPSPL